jgi:steroid delta-isomerase-like uncharacterized protein
MTTSTQQNRAVVQRFYQEIWNERNLAVVEEIFAPNCVTHQLSSGAAIETASRDPETVKHHVGEWVKAFPDLRFEVEEVLADGDRVVSRSVMHGTHEGDWHGIAPTGRQVTIRMMVIHRIADGQIAEDWVLVESLGFFQQLGLLQSTGEIIGRRGPQ